MSNSSASDTQTDRDEPDGAYEPIPEAPPVPKPTASEVDQRLKRLVKLVGTLLIARKDVKAVEVPIRGEYTWIPDRERAPRGTAASDMPCLPMSMEDFRGHLMRKRCMGTYLLDTDNNVKFFAIDIDLKPDNAIMFEVPDLTRLDEMFQSWTAVDEQAQGVLDISKMYKGNLEEALHDPEHVGYRWARIMIAMNVDLISRYVKEILGLPVIPVITGGGAHVIVPTGLIPAAEARVAANAVMEAAGYELFKGDCFWRPTSNDQSGIEIEVFPKQDTLNHKGGFGNLLRMPLGWHHGANMRTYFLDLSQLRAPMWDLPKADPIPFLESIATTIGIEV